MHFCNIKQDPTVAYYFTPTITPLPLYYLSVGCTHLCEGILKVLVPKPHDSTDRLAAQSSHFGSKVQGEGQSDQLRRGVCGLGKRTGDLRYVAISEPLEGAVRQFLEEVLDALVPAYLERKCIAGYVNSDLFFFILY